MIWKHLHEEHDIVLENISDIDCDAVVFCGTPRAWMGDIKGDRRTALFTMTEVWPLMPKAVEICNRLDLIVVPSTWAKKVFLESGVKTLIYVFPLGINPSRFPDVSRVTNHGEFTFLCQGSAPGDRKGWELVVEAFGSLRKEMPNARLILKWNGGDIPIQSKTNRITVINRRLSDSQLKELYVKADAFVYPSHGEGYGLMPLEAGSTGLPLIVTAGTGMSDYVSVLNREGACIPIVPSGSERATLYETIFRQRPLFWDTVPLEPIKVAMLWIYKNRTAAREMGKRGAELIRSLYNWESVVKQHGPMFLDLLFDGCHRREEIRNGRFCEHSSKVGIRCG